MLYTLIVIAGVGAAAAIVLAIFLLTVQNAPSDTIAQREPIREEELFRRNLLPGHSLFIVSSVVSPSNTMGVTVANPTSSNEFSDCSLIQEIAYPFYEMDRRTGPDIESLNVTLHQYDTLSPHFLDQLEFPLVPDVLEKGFNEQHGELDEGAMNFTEYADKIASRSWLILQCSKPSESIAFPHATIGGGTNAVQYHGGDTIRVRGIVGYSHVGIRVTGFEGSDLFVVNERLETGKGGVVDTSFTIPSETRKGTYTVWIDLPNDESMGFDFRIQ
jgi:hypothetical protein